MLRMVVLLILAAAPAFAAGPARTPPEKTAWFETHCRADAGRWGLYDCKCMANAFEAKRKISPELYPTNISSFVHKDSGLSCLSPPAVAKLAELECLKRAKGGAATATATAARACRCIGEKAAKAVTNTKRSALNAYQAFDAAVGVARLSCANPAG